MLKKVKQDENSKLELELKLQAASLAKASRQVAGRMCAYACYCVLQPASLSEQPASNFIKWSSRPIALSLLALSIRAFR